ncbi:MAG: hypothetical protein N2595_06025 [bacterium]|nr:hypothetical protein [bacterium]
MCATHRQRREYMAPAQPLGDLDAVVSRPVLRSHALGNAHAKQLE